MEKITCARKECEIVFTPATHNQKYHSSECCRLATNARIMEKYYEKRDQRAGKERWCKICEVTKLSRYNNQDTCSGCQTKNVTRANNAAIQMLIQINIA